MSEIATDIFGTFLLLSIFGIVIWQGYKTFRDRKRPHRAEEVPNITYGVWQGHNLGTTTMEPGDLTRIEREIRKESQ